MDLAEALLSEELRSLQRRRWSGVLALSSGEVTKGLFLREGRIVFAASNRDEDKLGETLFRKGRISRNELDAAFRESQGPSRRIGHALIRSGVISKDELDAEVAGQVQGIVLSLFRWTSGEVRRADADHPVAPDLILDLSTPRLLLEGARIFPDVDRLEQALGDPARSLRTAAPPPFDYPSLPESEAEQAVLRQAWRETPVGELLALGGFPRPALIRAVYGLRVGGLLADAAEDPLARGVDRPIRGGAARTSSDESPDLATSSAVSEGIAHEARRLIENGERADGIALLEQRLTEEPRDRLCRRLLALTLARDAAFSVAVERHFLTALALDPDDDELRYRLALYYRKAGMTARAILQLELVVGADPSHAAAWRDLRELQTGADPPRRWSH